VSNYTAVATATAVLTHIIDDELKRLGIEDVRLTFVSPSAVPKQDKSRTINIYLFDTGINAAWRNQELPMRGPDERFLQTPQAGINLHYLLSFYGAEDTLSPQLLLAAVIGALNANAVLTSEQIAATIANPPVAMWEQFLKLSDLARQTDLVKFHPMELDIDQMSKLWGMFHHADYNTSMVYHASVVLLDSPERVAAQLPATDVAPSTSASGLPAILEGAPARARPGDRLSIDYASGVGMPSHLVFNDVEVAISRAPGEGVPVTMDERHLEVALDAKLIGAARLESGSVLLRLAFRGERQPRVVSSPWRFELLPQVKGAPVAFGGLLQVEVTAPVYRDQQVTASLVPLPPQAGGRGTGQSASIAWVTPSVPTTALRFPLAGVLPDLYLVQIVVDGAASALEKEGGYFSRPRVDVPPTAPGQRRS
jgi:hypothetical protein